MLLQKLLKYSLRLLKRLLKLLFSKHMWNWSVFQLTRSAWSLSICAGVFQLSLSCTSTSLSVPTEPLVKQETVHVNACGPCALVHSLAYASPDWRKQTFFKQSLPEQAEAIITTYGEKRSLHRESRWQARKGMKSPDLAATATELLTRPITHLSQFISPPAKADQQLKSLYRHLSHSLSQGFPPIISFKQQLHKKFKTQSGYYWTTTKGHFISVIDVSAFTAQEFQFLYLDSLTGSTHQGKVHIQAQHILTTSPLTRQVTPYKINFPQLHLPEQKLTDPSFLSQGLFTHDLDAIIIAK